MGQDTEQQGVSAGGAGRGGKIAKGVVLCCAVLCLDLPTAIHGTQSAVNQQFCALESIFELAVDNVVHKNTCRLHVLLQSKLCCC
jgi:hypothetical protein